MTFDPSGSTNEGDFDLHIAGVTKIYGRTRALSAVTASFQAGTTTLVQGPNGSGKSTLLKVLALTTRPSEGDIRFQGVDVRVQPQFLRARLGFLGHASMLYPDLTAEENLALVAALVVRSPAEARERVELARERFDLNGFSSRPVRTYSRGQLQRVALARALLSRPSLLLLDEPSTGLDVASVGRLASVVEEERARGAIVVVVTHDPDFSSQLSGRKLEMRGGRIQKGRV